MCYVKKFLCKTLSPTFHTFPFFGPVKVFAEKTDGFEEYDNISKVDIERFGGIKIFRKYRKANRVKEFISNKNI